MTTITLDTPTPTGTLEELVDRLLEALFREAPKQPEPSPSLAKTVHEARRLRQTGDPVSSTGQAPDGALAALAGVDTANATDAQLRWLYARVAERRPAPVCWLWGHALQLRYRQGCGPDTPRRWHSGSCGGPGDALAGGQAGLPAQPAGAEALGQGLPSNPTGGRRFMVVANATVDPVSGTGRAIPALKTRHPLGDVVEATGVALRGTGRVRQGVCPFHQEAEGSFTVYCDTQRFYCFGCGAGGDVLDFVQRMEASPCRRPSGGLMMGRGRSWQTPNPLPQIAAPPLLRFRPGTRRC